MSTAPEPENLDLRRALKPPPAVALVPVPPHVAALTSFIFGGLSRLRGRRAMHPIGVVTTATLDVPDDDALPSQWRDLSGVTGVARFSKSIGLPGRVPDVLGIALRFGGQDLLLASALSSAPVAQHLLVPAAGFDGTLFSSLLPHRVGRSAAIIQARLSQPLPEADSYLEAVADAGVFTIELSAVGLFGSQRRLGTVTIGDVLEGEAADRVRFDPWRATGGLRPTGPLQRMRASAYAASRRATRH
jgi:hypothetical protein